MTAMAAGVDDAVRLLLLLLWAYSWLHLLLRLPDLLLQLFLLTDQQQQQRQGAAAWLLQQVGASDLNPLEQVLVQEDELTRHLQQELQELVQLLLLPLSPCNKHPRS
jgi:hypothetical protein